MGTVIANDLDVVALEDNPLKIGPFDLGQLFINWNFIHNSAAMAQMGIWLGLITYLILKKLPMKR